MDLPLPVLDVPDNLAPNQISEVSEPKTYAVETKSGTAIDANSRLFVDTTGSSADDGGETIIHDSVGVMKQCQFADSFVTEDEVKASLAKKEENLESLSLSPSGSCAGGSLSQLSTLTKNSTLDDLNLSAIRNRQNELINSLKTNLDTSCLSIASDDLNDEQLINISTSTAINHESVFDRNDSSNSSSLEAVPPAAKFSQTLKHNPKNLKNRTEYEEAFASLNEILSSTTDPDTILELYSSKLEAYKEEDNKKFDEIFSQIDNEKKSFFSIVEEDTIGELEDQINSISEGNSTIKNSIADGSEFSTNETLTSSQPTVLENKSRRDEVTTSETTVVTPCDENKDPENLIIGDDEGAGEDFDEDVLLASDDEVDTEFLLKNATKEPTKVWKEFRSTDEDENRDNNDPKWEYLKNLGSDYERYKAVEARWNNLEIPNPKRDLTCRCRKVRRSKMYVEELSRKNEYGKRMLCSPECDRRSAKRPRRESCTVLFDWSIQQLIQDAENERSQIEREQEQRLNELADQQSMDQLMAQQERKNEMFIREMKQRHYMEAESLMKDFRRRREELTETTRLKMEALRKAGDEVRQFHEFYPNKNGANGTHDANAVIYLTEMEVQEILEVEKMLIRFESFYSTPV